MPNVKSAIKRVRTSAERRIRNRHDRARLRSTVKRAREEAGGGSAGEVLERAMSLLDKAARKGLIHRNKAARDKSRLMRLARQAGSSPA
ncbi:MAG: 30S ribosomal protein S20 [Gemmatimonadetes bacterium]|nr:30S ribosomal protein S20 [Gemmatimonadota bacterium]